MLRELSDCKGRLQKLNQCKIKVKTFREIEKKKEDPVPKRGDFFHVKVFRKDEQHAFHDKSSTFKFA